MALLTPAKEEGVDVKVTGFAAPPFFDSVMLREAREFVSPDGARKRKGRLVNEVAG